MSSIYTDKNIKFPIKNVFEIDQAEIYSCIISSYSASLSRLEVTIALMPGFNIVYKIVFNGVKYINIPTEWNAVNFDVASPADCIRVARRLPRYNSLPDSEILSLFVLYVINFPEIRAEILCSAARKIVV